MSTSPETQAYYRDRYNALLEAAREHAAKPKPALKPNPATLPPELVLRREDIPAGWYASFEIARGQSLRIVNTSGTPGVSVLLWNIENPTERFSTADSAKVQWTTKLTSGMLMYSDMGRVLASITDDTCGRHDLLVGASSRHSLAWRGASGRNSRDNFMLAVAKYGLGRRDVPPAITFFSEVSSGEGGRLGWAGDVCEPGDRVDLRAEMNLLAVVSNCPHPMAPETQARGGVQAVLWRSPPADADDLCRHATPEAERAFANTDQLFALRQGAAS